MALRLTIFVKSSVCGHFSSKWRHFKYTQLHQAYLDDFGGYPESQEEPSESVSQLNPVNACGVVTHQLLWKMLEANYETF